MTVKNTIAFSMAIMAVFATQGQATILRGAVRNLDNQPVACYVNAPNESCPSNFGDQVQLGNQIMCLNCNSKIVDYSSNKVVCDGSEVNMTTLDHCKGDGVAKAAATSSVNENIDINDSVCLPTATDCPTGFDTIVQDSQTICAQCNIRVFHLQNNQMICDGKIYNTTNLNTCNNNTTSTSILQSSEGPCLTAATNECPQAMVASKTSDDEEIVCHEPCKLFLGGSTGFVCDGTPYKYDTLPQC